MRKFFIITIIFGIICFSFSICFAELSEEVGLGELASSYFEEGMRYYRAKEYKSAIEKFEKGLEGYNVLGNQKRMAFCINLIGLSYTYIGQPEKGLKYQEEALEINREEGDRGGEGQDGGEGYTLNNIGVAYHAMGEYKKAIEYYEQALVILNEVGPSWLRRITLGNMKIAYIDLGLPEDAKEIKTEDLTKKKSVRNWNEAQNEGYYYRELGDYEKALKYYKEALEIAKKLGNKQEEGWSLYNIGYVYYKMDEYDKAIDYSNQSLLIAEEVGDKEMEGWSRNTLGYSYRLLGEYENALKHSAKSIFIGNKIKNKEMEGWGFATGASIYNTLGQYERALEYGYKMLEIAREIRDKDMEGWALGRVSGSLENLGEFQKAIEIADSMLELAREIKDLDMEGWALNNLGDSYEYIGDYKKALRYFEESLKAFKKLGNKGSEGSILGNMGTVYWFLGDYEKALNLGIESLKIARRFNDQEEEIWSLFYIGLAYWGLKDYSNAIKYCMETLELMRGYNIESVKSYINIIIGATYNDMAEYNKALDYNLKGLSIANESKIPYALYWGAWKTGDSYRGLGELEEAVKYYKMSIDAIENMRSGLKSEELKMALLGDKIEVYESLIELLIEMESYEDAYNYLERSRSRAFLDLLAYGNFTSTKELDKNTQEQDKEYQREISNIRSKLSREAENNSLNTELEKLEKEYEKFLKEINLKNSELASLLNVNILTSKEIQNLIKPSISIIEYVSTKDNTYAFLVSKDNVKVYKIPIKEDDINEMVNNLLLPNISNKNRRPESTIDEDYESIKTSDYDRERNREKFLKSSIDLHNLLIKTLEADIMTERVIIIPYGSLHKVPFTALYDGTEYLIDKYSISILPSASVLAYLKDKGGSNKERLIAFADPKTNAVPLYYAETEVNEITKLFPFNKVYKKSNATETNFKTTSGGYDIVHMACHGEFNDKTPILSCLLLTKDSQNDGYLRLNELFGLDLTEANLVTLSACETALSEVQTGDDLVGLSRGLIYAGAESILASLWSVDDKSTAVLMTKFYENWKSGMGKAEALRQAQIYVKSLEGYEHPFYWAAFELIGDGK